MTCAPLAGTEYPFGSADTLSSGGVHVYRQLMRPNGTTREFLVDVDGAELELVEGSLSRRNP